MKKISAFLLSFLLVFLVIGCSKTTTSKSTISTTTKPTTKISSTALEIENDEKRMQAVKKHLDNILANCRSQTKNVPLFADGIDTFTKELVKWANTDKTFSTISNYTSQQNFMRTLVAYSEVTEDPTYKDAAVKATKYFMKFYQHKNGLFKWGGHEYVNLETLEVEGPENKGLVHELKNHYPYYELMIEVDKSAVLRFLEQTWAAHVVDWNTLDINRHGENTTEITKYETAEKSTSILVRPLPSKNVVDVTRTVTTESNTTALILPESQGLTFINAGSDLYYNAYLLGNLSGNSNATAWGKYLATQYNLARNPVTGLPVYQFSQPRQRDTTDDDLDTNSKYGDRAKRQFERDYGAVALEGNALFKNISPIMIDSININLYIGKTFNDQDLIDWAIDTIKCYYKYALVYDNNNIMKLLPMWNDGQSMYGYQFTKDGYYGNIGTTVNYISTSSEYLLPMVRAFSLSDQDNDLWELIREFAKGLGYGDLGDINGNGIELIDNPVDLATQKPLASSYGVMSLVELYNHTGRNEYLAMARKIADNIVTLKFNRGYFVKSIEYRYCRINDNEALSLIYLDAVINGKYDEMPVYLADTGYVHGDFYDYSQEYEVNAIQNGYDTSYIYNQVNLFYQDYKDEEDE